MVGRQWQPLGAARDVQTCGREQPADPRRGVRELEHEDIGSVRPNGRRIVDEGAFARLDLDSGNLGRCVDWQELNVTS